MSDAGLIDGAARRREAIELALFIVCFFAVWTVRATYGYGIDEAIRSPGARIV